MANPVLIDTITFSESIYAIGSIDPVYTFSDVLKGRDFKVFAIGQIVNDSCSPTTPVIAANASYSGPVTLRFSDTVSSISLDAGCFDEARSTRVSIFGLNGYRIETTVNKAGDDQYQNFSFDYGENVIKKVIIRPIGNEPAGFAVDNVTVAIRPEHRTVANTGDVKIDNLLGGTKWATNKITYSFHETGSEQPGYGDGPETFSTSSIRKTTMAPFSDAQKAMTLKALGMFDDIGDVTFQKVSDTGGAPGMMRFGRADIEANADGWYPEHDAHAGDVRIDVARPTGNAGIGSYNFFVFIHEVGHALGLKHPHDTGGNGTVLPAGQDSHEFSIMSYRSFPGQSVASVTNDVGSYPHTLMMHDIAAIQKLYGANYSTNAGDTVYAFDPAKAKIFETIWDGGGEDTYDGSAYGRALSIDLNPGKWSVLKGSQLAKLGTDAAGDVFARGSVFNALLYKDDPRSLIENAIGGSKGDRLTGNQGANALTGNDGNDILDGLAAGDVLNGNKGNDMLVGGSGNDRLFGGNGKDDLNGGPGSDLLFGGNGDDTISGHAGHDVIRGNAGQDVMSGGSGNDRFIFASVADSPSSDARRDTVVDFAPGQDRIDLRQTDADSTSAGQQDWTFIGSNGYSGTAGELRYFKGSSFGVLRGDTNGDGVSDFEIEFATSVNLTAGDLLL